MWIYLSMIQESYKVWEKKSGRGTEAVHRLPSSWQIVLWDEGVLGCLLNSIAVGPGKAFLCCHFLVHHLQF